MVAIGLAIGLTIGLHRIAQRRGQRWGVGSYIVVFIGVVLTLYGAVGMFN